MGSRVEQFEQIRRDRDREGLSLRALAARHGVHRPTVKQALASPVPLAKRAPVGRPAPKLGAYRAVIDSWLEADRDAPCKQRYTARRIHRRLVDEHGADVAESTVRQYVRGRKRELGWPVGEVFVPQDHASGVEAEVDWGEALVVLGGLSVNVHPFVMRASAVGRPLAAIAASRSHTSFSGNAPSLTRFRARPNRISGASLLKTSAPAIARDQHTSHVTTQPRRRWP
jgi:transposase